LGFAVAIALTTCLGTIPSAAQSGQAATLAVLPLENNSGDAAQDFFAGGMTDEIAVALAGVRGLGVVARSSSFQLKPSDRDSQAAGKALNAGHIVQGAARMRDDRVQLSLRLTRSSDGVRLWSEDFDARLSEIFDLEEEIARKVANALQLPVGADERLIRSRTRDGAAYLDFLRSSAAKAVLEKYGFIYLIRPTS